MEFLTNRDAPSGVTAVVSFMSLQIATKIHKMSHKMSNNALSTWFHDFSSIGSDPKLESKPEKKVSKSEDFHRLVYRTFSRVVQLFQRSIQRSESYI